jgi:hypothetical protein
MLITFPKARTGASRAKKRAAASRPRKSKNGTPEERAAKAAALPAVARVIIPRPSKNGTPEERAAKRAATATVVDVTSRLTRRAAATRATKGEPMTREEFLSFYNAATPAQQAVIRAKLEALAEQNAAPPDQSA